MNISSIIGLVNNAALLLALSIVYDMLGDRPEVIKNSIQQVLTGIALSTIGIAIMMNPWEFMPGVVFDTRSVLLSVSGLFLGTIPTLFAVLITGSYRLYLSGAGAWTGVAVIATSGGIGLFWRHLRRNKELGITALELYLLGIIVHIAMLLWMFSLPWPVAKGVLSKISFPVLLIFPVTTALLGWLMTNSRSRKHAEEDLRQSEERFRYLSDGSMEAIFFTKNGFCLEANQVAVEMFGYDDQSQFIGRFGTEIIAPESYSVVKAHMLADIFEPYEAVGMRKNGTRFPISIRAKTMPYKDKGFVRVTSITDITEIKKVEKALMESEEDLKESQRIAHVGSWHLNIADNQLIWSDELCKMCGIDPAFPPPPYTDYQKLFTPESWERLSVAMKKTIDTGIPYEIELETLQEGVSNGWMWMHGKTVLGATGVTVGLKGAAQDITERKRAEVTLQKAEKQFRVIFEKSPYAMALTEINSGHLVEVNEMMCEKVGIGKEYLIGKTTTELNFYSPENRAIFTDLLLKNGKVDGLEMHFQTNNQVYLTKMYSELITINNSEYILTTFEDITERRRAEEMLNLHMAIMETVAEGIFLIGLEDNIIKWTNSKFEKLFGYDSGEMVGMSVDKVNAPTEKTQTETRLSIVDVLRQNGEWHGEVKSIKKNGTHFWCYIHVSLFNHPEFGTVMVSAHTDITERKQAEMEMAKLEDQLLQAQKMESIGSLAGGIAHDLNNILFPISGLSEMLLDEMAPDDSARASLEQIHKSAIRGSDLVKQILAFSRQSNPQKLPIRIQPILKEVLHLARATIPMNIEIISRISSDCGMVFADPTQMHQIAMNLITNAYHAVETTGGRIDISMEETVVGTDLLQDNTPLSDATAFLHSGRYAHVSVSDTGPGIDPALMQRIFEPYFTTKEQGKGTGLGLSVVHGIIKEHGGDIRVCSEVGKGTVFNVYLPLLQDANDNKSIAVTRKYPTGSESILVVDDEEPIARMIQTILEKMGYQVTVKTSSPDALAVFRSNPNIFDIVISDRGMPNMTGEQLARELISTEPGIPIIICTGFSDENDENHAMEIGVKGILKKPVGRGDLADMVRKVLDEAADNTLANKSGQADTDNRRRRI